MADTSVPLISVAVMAHHNPYKMIPPYVTWTVFWVGVSLPGYGFHQDYLGPGHNIHGPHVLRTYVLDRPSPIVALKWAESPSTKDLVERVFTGSDVKDAYLRQDQQALDAWLELVAQTKRLHLQRT